MLSAGPLADHLLEGKQVGKNSESIVMGTRKVVRASSDTDLSRDYYAAAEKYYGLPTPAEVIERVYPTVVHVVRYANEVPCRATHRGRPAHHRAVSGRDNLDDQRPGAAGGAASRHRGIVAKARALAENRLFSGTDTYQ